MAQALSTSTGELARIDHVSAGQVSHCYGIRGHDDEEDADSLSPPTGGASSRWRFITVDDDGAEPLTFLQL